MKNYSDFLTSNGVVDSRAHPLRSAMKELFSAYCALDLGQRAQFDSIVADRCVRDAVIQFAEHENGCNTNLDTHVKKEQPAEPRCSDLITQKLAGRIDDLLDIVPHITADRITIGHTNDSIVDCTVKMLGDSYGYAVAGDYKDGHNVPEFIAREICDEVADMHRERQLDAVQSEYGLCWAAGQDECGAYIEWQLSWGGPADGFRFFLDLAGDVYAVVYYYQDWADGADMKVTDSESLELLRDAFVLNFGDDSYAADWWINERKGA